MLTLISLIESKEKLNDLNNHVRELFGEVFNTSSSFFACYDNLIIQEQRKYQFKIHNTCKLLHILLKLSLFDLRKLEI